MTGQIQTAARCGRCYLQPPFCICPALLRGRAAVPVRVIRHFRERGKLSNSGRLVELVLDNAQVIDFGERDVALDAAAAAPPGSWLVFPAGSADATDAPQAPQQPREAPAALVLLDGTWGQARRMSHRIPGLAALPRLALPPPRPGVVRLRRPHQPWAVSTIEATALALEAIGDREASELLHRTWDLLVRAVWTQSGRSLS